LPFAAHAQVNNFWTTHEIKHLAAVYAEMPKADLLLTFPRHSARSIYSEASKRGLCRRNRAA
jgi:hypothetical protein